MITKRKQTPTNPRVSIVLPCYNGERFLSQSIESVINQTFKDWELIIVNDCSTDSSPFIAEKYIAQDNRISIIHNKTNKKLPASLNIGFANARGKYFTWTSDDNIAKPNWLSTLVSTLDNNQDVSMVVADMTYIDETGKFITTASKQYPNRNPKQLAYLCNVGAAFMYRKSIADKIGKYDESAFCAEDFDYWCRIALNGQLMYIPDNIYDYRVQSGSLTATKKDEQIIKTTRIIKKYYKQFITVYHMNWLQKQKLTFLLKPHVKQTCFGLIFRFYTFCAFNLCNIVFFWNSNLRHKFKSILKIKL